MAADDDSLELLPRAALIRTGPVDHADWNFRPLIGTVQRLRFKLIKELLGRRKFGRLLEIGYGSGVFMPELAKHAGELFGIDPHPKPREVQAVLRDHGVKATLVSGSAERLPYEDASLDCVVSVSAMEYVADLPAACRELLRVLCPGGAIVIATPGVSPIWDLALRLSTGENPRQYADRRQRLLPTLGQYFRTQREIAVPALGGKLFRLYNGLHLARP